MISEKDLIFLEDVGRLDGTELGEYIQSVLEVYQDGYVNCGMSEDFKKALEVELQRLADDCNKFFEIEEYEEPVTRMITGKRLKDRG